MSSNPKFSNIRQEIATSPTYLGVESFWEDRMRRGAKKCEYNPTFCVGRAYRIMSKYFNCYVSHFAYPDGRKKQMMLEGTLPRKKVK